jgi:hypothetical protein
MADWRAGTLDHEAALRTITAYLDSLHRRAQLRTGEALGCCAVEDAITVVPGEAAAASVASALSQVDAPTARAGWVDSPEVMARRR